MKCPAVTGASFCTPLPRSAHRCLLTVEYHDDLGSGPADQRYTHRCECGYTWTCLGGSIGDLLDLLKPKEPS